MSARLRYLAVLRAPHVTRLLCTALIAAHARLRVIPRLSADTLPLMAWHVAAVTLLSVGFVAVGVSLRFGGL